MHWASEYIGLPWSATGDGPPLGAACRDPRTQKSYPFHCWALVRHVQRERFGRDLPAIPNPDDLLAIARAFRDHPERRRWDLVEAPEEGDCVLMRQARYSGGAAVAMLVAARRSDVASLRTVAGNLDPEAVNRHHGVSPMPGSLNPADVAGKLAHLPQRHFVGGRDKIVPPFIADAHQRRSGDGRCVTIARIEVADHEGGWEGIWLTVVRDDTWCSR